MSEFVSTSTGLQTTDQAALVARPCLIHAVVLTTAAAAGELLLYDGLTATGTVVAAIKTATNNDSTHQHFDAPVYCKLGLSTDVTGAGASYIVYYSLA